MQQQALDVAKPFALFVEFEKPDGDSFNFGWKFYSSENGAQQAFHDLYEKRSFFNEFRMKPVCKIEGCGMTSIFEINHRALGGGKIMKTPKCLRELKYSLGYIWNYIKAKVREVLKGLKRW